MITTLTVDTLFSHWTPILSDQNIAHKNTHRGQRWRLRVEELHHQEAAQ